MNELVISLCKERVLTDSCIPEVVDCLYCWAVLLPKCFEQIVSIARVGGGGLLKISLGGKVRRGPPHTLTLFKTNIADFPTLFKTEFQFLIPCLSQRKSILINIRA